MLKNEINSILNMDISNSKKSEILQILFKQDDFEEKENIEMKREGGDIKKLRPTEDITIGGIEYSVEIADTPEKREDGLSRVQSLKEDEGMLFIHPNVTDGYYTMADTDVDLDIVFIDEDQSVIKVSSVKARTPDPIKCTGFKYVLEVPIDSGIEKGDDLELDFELDEDEQEDLKKHSKSKMLVLDSNGDVQMKLEGGERIVSMIKTRQLIKAALKAYHSDEDSDYRKVGKLIFKELDAQDGRDPQYVTKSQLGSKLNINMSGNYFSSKSKAQNLGDLEITMPEQYDFDEDEENTELNESPTAAPYSWGNELLSRNSGRTSYGRDHVGVQYDEFDPSVGEQPVITNFIKLLQSKNVPIKITETFRDPNATYGTKDSWHKSGLAMDIVPTNGATYNDIKKYLTSDPEIVQYMLTHGLGYLDETSKAAQKKTNATGAHFHIGVDPGLRNNYLANLDISDIIQKYKSELGTAYLSKSYQRRPIQSSGKKSYENNPFNLRYNSGIKWDNSNYSGGGFESFNSEEAGVRAGIINLKNTIANGNNTITKLINKYAPTSENNTSNYIKNVSTWTGIDPNATLDWSNKEQMRKLAAAIARQESQHVLNNEYFDKYYQ